MTRTIAILFHKNKTEQIARKYVISYLADIWRKDGHKVIFLFGINKFIPADICIVHVDLSVVPEKYLIFAKRYPITLNGKVQDIRKNYFSKNIVSETDDYQGKIIIKSNENYTGSPERNLNKNQMSMVLSRIKIKLNLVSQPFNVPRDYQIYDRLGEVPSMFYRHPDFIVEKFLPENVGDLYFVHFYLFLGDCKHCLRLGSKDPIVNGRSCISTEVVKPHPDVIRIQKEMNFDYGKFDYCLNDGKVVLLDVNKTIGFGGLKYTKELATMHRQRAEGLYAYFK